MNSKQKRPKFLNLLHIHLPVTGVTSFAHRVSGAFMIVAIPALIYLFDLSLRDATGFADAQSLLDSFIGKLVCSVLIWSLAHHILAGIRFLLLDIDVGDQLTVAKASAWLVNVAGIIVFVFLAIKIWL
jgi:succinate dehydrogenase / fumarate reductase cytochrome b subunit